MIRIYYSKKKTRPEQHSQRGRQSLSQGSITQPGSTYYYYYDDDNKNIIVRGEPVRALFVTSGRDIMKCVSCYPFRLVLSPAFLPGPNSQICSFDLPQAERFRLCSASIVSRQCFYVDAPQCQCSKFHFAFCKGFF